MYIYIYTMHIPSYIYTRSYACVCICIYIYTIYIHTIYIHTIYRRRCIWSSASCYLEPVQVQLTIPPGIHHVSIHQSYLPIIPSISIPFFLTQYYLIKICFNPIFSEKNLGASTFKPMYGCWPPSPPFFASSGSRPLPCRPWTVPLAALMVHPTDSL